MAVDQGSIPDVSILTGHDLPQTIESPATTTATTTAQTTPDNELTQAMVEEEVNLAKVTQKEEDKRIQEEAQAQFDTTVKEQRMKRLHFLLEKSGAYATILGQKLAKQQEEARERNAAPAPSTTTTPASSSAAAPPAAAPEKRGRGRLRKRKADDADYQLGDYLNEEDIKRRKQSNNDVGKAIQEDMENMNSKPTSTVPARQPSLVTGGVLRDYQLAGVEWLISLWENGLNGILADEMGLGKTLQTISFIAHLKAMKVAGPYLIVTPLSTLANWVNEFKRFAPKIPVLLYHGSKEERQHMVNRKMPKKKETTFDFPIIVTSYEIVMNDRKHLQRYNWKYIVVDEGHRIKNLNCKLIKELKSYSSANRLLLTGTPLQNNLAELWSLLNFLLPDIFDDLDMFQSWFDFSDIHEKSGQDRIIKEEEEDRIISSLHTILQPFLLRRLKTDVEHSLPKKKEYLLYAPLTRPQKSLYDAILKRDLRDYLIKRKTKGLQEDPQQQQQPSQQPQPQQLEEDQTNENDEGGKAQRNTKSTVDYKEKTDRQYFKELEKAADENTTPVVDQNAVEKKQQLSAAVKQVNGLHLQNIVMQLRKVCNHPFLFDWPIDPKTNTHVLNADLAAQSGKVLLLDRLLTGLFDRGHKVLVFSQMTKMLDILEDWATVLKGWPICRLDGGVPQEARRQQIEAFNEPSSPFKLFLLSTRAGGLGINLTAADTVVIFDSDWNPQMDLQAQDRVHRIGQTKPVLIYRFVAANTVEAKMLERATAKRRLEKLVIQKGKFKTPVSASAKRDQESTLRELAEILASEDGEQVQIVSHGDKVVSDEDLDKLLDRSEQVFEEQNASSTGGFREINTSELQDSKNEVLATRM
ncbi:SNF2 family N-terminal domain-containing protein [Zychaea mexicana]|uniref:SNF2 family N-terminal domain-containing protein n=1 Tax=Zychaea mexicana TaxID=64656 RepID=UPI0022FF246D|nr:SNF2 family N-terminal domain-containing protein [Zychaea mexicana]KAI9496031.1 SNF2 family N-terminal domain-containing protein [Zychaea mexicana]